MTFNFISSSTDAADPRKPGPYPVGVRTEIYVDQGRECSTTNKDRTLVTEIWYPAVDASLEKKPNQFVQFYRGPAGLLTFSLALKAFGGDMMEVNKNFKNVARRNAEFRKGNYPLLVFSHGNGGFRHQNVFQCEYLASHGYIVVACDHTGNAAMTELPDQIVIYNKETRKSKFSDERPNDISFLIHHLIKMGKSNNHFLKGGIKENQCGILGHSFGGYTVCRTSEIEPMVKAILPMTLACTLSKEIMAVVKGENDKGEKVKVSKEDIDKIKFKSCPVPMLVILADHDKTVNELGNYLSTSYYKQGNNEKYLLNFKGAGHFTFTELTQINPNFGDGIGSDKDKEGNVTFEYSDALEDQRITNEYSVAFFDTYVKGDTSARKFLDKNQYKDEFSYDHQK